MAATRTEGRVFLPTGMRAVVPDEDYTALPTDEYITYSSLTATRAVTLPAANAVPPNWKIVIIDEAGTATPAGPLISVNRAGSDTLFGPGVFASIVASLNTSYAWVTCTSDGVNSWNVLNSAPNYQTTITDFDTVIPTSGAVVDYIRGQTTALLSLTGSINAKNTGATNLYTVPTGFTAFITGAVVHVQTATSITVAPTLGIGVAAGEDDIFASVALTNLNTAGETWTFVKSGLGLQVSATGIVKVGIDTAATGTSMTITIALLGYLK